MLNTFYYYKKRKNANARNKINKNNIITNFRNIIVKFNSFLTKYCRFLSKINIVTTTIFTFKSFSEHQAKFHRLVPIKMPLDCK